jgi:hypothetical protein
VTFTAPVTRVEQPGVAGGERQALAASLDYQRATVVTKLDGLDDEQVRRVMTPSGLSPLGLVKHLWGVEHWWFTIQFARTGEQVMWVTEGDWDADFRIEPHETTDGIVAGYLAACERSRAIVAAASLDDTVPNERRGQVDLRWVILHILEETARHNGHMDIMREMLDGATGV